MPILFLLIKGRGKKPDEKKSKEDEQTLAKLNSTNQMSVSSNQLH